MKLKKLIDELTAIQEQRGGDIEVEVRNTAGDRENAEKVCVLEQRDTSRVVID